MSEKLKPCPYCNEKAKIIKETDHHGEYYNLGCSFSECIAADAFYTETEVPLEDAILRWNSRPIEDSLCDQLAACQKELAEEKNNQTKLFLGQRDGIINSMRKELEEAKEEVLDRESLIQAQARNVLDLYKEIGQLKEQLRHALDFDPDGMVSKIKRLEADLQRANNAVNDYRMGNL